MKKTVSKIRADFPLLSRKIDGHYLAYLDSAATSLKPWAVINRVGQFLTFESANVHRGAYQLSNQATEAFELSRQKVAQFIGATSDSEVVWVKGTTDGINTVAQGWGEVHCKPGDKILITAMEHHANIVPWQMLAKKKGLEVVVAPLEQTHAQVDETILQQLLADPRVKIFAMTYASNVLGTVNPIQKWIAWAKAKNSDVVTLVDAAQWVAYRPTSVQALDCDFLVFSGHKIFGPYGIGVLFAKKSRWSEMQPIQFGGSMISQVQFQESHFLPAPHGFEAGTPNIEGALGLGAAIDFMNSLDWQEIHAWEELLLKQLTAGLEGLGGIKIHSPKNHDKVPVISFTLVGAHASDVTQILDQQRIAIRSGHLCAQPLMGVLGVTGVMRASLSIYNNADDVDRLLRGLEKAKGMLL